MKYKVWVIADSSGRWNTNGLEFDTEGAAEIYARDLAGRWMAVKDWQVRTIEPIVEVYA